MEFNLRLDEILTVSEMKRFADTAVELINKYTPEDTHKLMVNTKITKQPTKQDLSVVIENNTDYAIYVEEGIQGRKYNYYKGGGRKSGGSPFYSGVGAHMFQRAVNDLENKNL